MTISDQTSVRAGSSVPVSWTDAVQPVVVRTFAAVDRAAAGLAGAKRRIADARQVCAFTPHTDFFAIEDALPGPSGWSPPI
jgi:hypothetical protein